jgi:C6 transcription factor Pro1
MSLRKSTAYHRPSGHHNHHRPSHHLSSSNSSSNVNVNLLNSKNNLPIRSTTTDGPMGVSSSRGSLHGHHHHHMSQHHIQSSGADMSSPESDDFDSYDQSFATPGLYDPYCVPMYSGSIAQTPVQYGYQPYEVDVKTERQMYVNDVPTRRDSSISTFSTWVPPPPHAMLPSYTGDEWTHQTTHSTDSYYTPHQPHRVPTNDLDEFSHEEDLDFNFFQYSHAHPAHTLPSTQLAQQKLDTPVETDSSTTIPLEDADRPLFSYMLTNVLPLLFPILNANQHGSVRSDILLPALENNKAYLHSCLTAAAVHQRAALGRPGHPAVSEADVATVEGDIVRHKFAFVQEVVTALSNDTHHVEILEATLGMIGFSTCVGRAPPSSLPTQSLPSPTLDAAEANPADIPWHSHFQAATELVTKLALPQSLESMPATGASPPFNMTLTAWIDILGSTMLGRSPAFANTYRTKHLSGSTSGLAELMGCHDGVMYLLSEIACLDSLKRDGKLDDHAICSHVASLGEQLNATENVPTGTLDPETGLPETAPLHVAAPYSERSGALRPRQLSKNMTAIFQKAARVYLCSLVPHYHPSQPATCALIEQMTELLAFIPSGPGGFDKSLVWPYLICGANSMPSSSLRRALADRIELMGDEMAETGAFGRMIRLLGEVWRRNDPDLVGGCEATPVTAGGASPTIAGGQQASHPGGAPGVVLGQQQQQQQVTPTKARHGAAVGQYVHWRDVMQMNGWDFLLI